MLKEFLEKLVQHGQIDTLLDMYRENMITTEVLVSKAEASGIREDMIDRISVEETPELEQKFFVEWKPDFTKLTFREKKRIEAAEADKETTPHEDIN